jgi:hypothetical protein
MTLPIFAGFYALPPGQPAEPGLNLTPVGYAGACVLEGVREHFSRFQKRWTKVLTWRLTCAECGDQFRVSTGANSTRIGPRCRWCYYLAGDTPQGACLKAHERAMDEARTPMSYFIFDKEERLTHGGRPVTPQDLARAWVLDGTEFRRPTAADTMGHRVPSRTPGPRASSRPPGVADLRAQITALQAQIAALTSALGTRENVSSRSNGDDR